MIYVNYFLGMGLGMIIMMNASTLHPLGILCLVASGMVIGWAMKFVKDDIDNG